MIQMTSDEAFKEVKEACECAEIHTDYYALAPAKSKRLEKALEIMEKVFKIYKGKFEEEE